MSLPPVTPTRRVKGAAEPGAGHGSERAADPIRRAGDESVKETICAYLVGWWCSGRGDLFRRGDLVVVRLFVDY